MTVKQFEELKEVWAKIEAAAPPIPDITHW
jgi:hypothetical protein